MRANILIFDKGGVWMGGFFMDEEMEMKRLLINPAHQLPDLKVGEMYAEVAEYTQAGNFWDFIWGNVTLGQKATFRYDRKESPFLNKDTDYLRNLFCSSLCSEIVSAKAIRIGKSTPTPEYACPSHSRADSNRKHLTTRRTTV